MPLIRLSTSNYYNWLVTTILLLGKVILSCSCCKEKKLVYITIAALTGRQPSLYIKCM